MLIKLKLFFFLAILFGLHGCSDYPETPEAVVEKFVNHLSSGECEEAKDLCINNARETIQGSIDAGCESYETTIDSVVCDIKGEKAICDCHETRQPLGIMTFSYKLETVEGKWKISDNGKDYGMDLDMQE